MFDTNLSIYFCLSLIVQIFAVLAFTYFFYIATSDAPTILWYEEEKDYLDVTCDPPEKKPFPSIRDTASVDLSVIVPAYNEEKRLPKMLDECFEFLNARVKDRPSYSYEIIIVDDGSSDRTTKVGHEYVAKFGANRIRVMTLVENRGKGGAVRLGMLSARGKLLLFADADGATKFSDITKLETEIDAIRKNTEDAVVIGSRAHLEKEAIATRSTFRTVLMLGFHLLVWLFGVRSVRDTQCGFKLFTRQSALALFSLIRVERWAFDVELLYVAERLSMKVSEVAVNWTEIEGSKLVPFWSWLQMGKDLVLIWLKYKTRFWTIDTTR